MLKGYGLAAGLVFAMGAAHGHMSGLNMPAGPFALGAQVNITWSVEVTHGGAPMVVYLSRNNGTTWDSIAGVAGSAAAGMKSYTWTVAGAPALQAKIRIYQRVPPNMPANTTNDYNLVSAAFAFGPALPILPALEVDFFSVRQFKGAISIHLQGSSFRSAEISNLNGVVMRSLGFAGGSGAREIWVSTAGLPMGKAILRISADGKPPSNRIIMIRR